MKNKKSFILAIAMAVSMLSGTFAVDASANMTFAELMAKNSSNSSTSDSKTAKVSKSVSGIKKVCGLKSDVETSVDKCIVDVNSKVNPYDVVYDYGKDYNAYVAACDWSLVFDANYYAKQFPMLAMLYHNDKKLLLKHFQTVGIQEGRQGNSKFNVGVYKANCDKSVSKAFGKEYEGYYFYYMLNYKSQKSVKTTAKNAKVQQTTIKTALQAQEFKDINKYRAEVKADALKFDSEAAAFANYRSWVNAHDNYHAHDWLHENSGTIDSLLNKTIMPALNAFGYCENECERLAYDSTGKVHSSCYRNSKGHYETLIDPCYDVMGVSNSYASKTNKLTVQVDTFVELN